MDKIYKIVGKNILFNCGFDYDSCVNSPCRYAGHQGCRHPKRTEYMAFLETREAKNIREELNKT